MKKHITALGIIMVFLFGGGYFLQHVARVLVNHADASSNTKQYPEEAELHNRINTLLDEIGIISDANIRQGEEWRHDFRALTDNFPPSPYITAIKNHLSDGALTLTKDMILRDFDTLVQQQKAREATSDEEKQKEIVRKIRETKRSLQKNLKTLLSKIKRLPRMKAKISVSDTSGPVPLVTSFDGLSSQDPNNITIPATHYHWSYIDIDGTERDLGTGPNKALTLKKPGSYVIRLEVVSASKKDIVPAVDFVTIRAEPPLLTPDFTINGKKMGSIITIPLKDAERGISFDPSISIVPEGREIEEYIWSFDGSKQSTGGNPEIIKHIFTTTGQHRVSLEVRDNTGKKKSKKVTITVQSSIAIIDMSNEQPRVGEVVVFSGQRSSLENKKATRYDWKIYKNGEGLIAEFQNKPQFSHIFYDAGEYEIQLFIGNGISTTKSFIVRSKPPFAHFISRVDDPAHPARVTFDASKSYDPDKENITFSWDFDGDGNLDVRNTRSPIVSYTYTKKGMFTPTLTVTDSGGQYAKAAQNIQISSLFSADFSAERFAVQKGQPIVFRVETNEGTQFHWNFGDGQEKDTTILSQEHIYEKAGDYVVTLTAYDASGNRISVQKTVHVGDGSSPIPIITVRKNGEEIHPVANLCGNGKEGIEIFRYDLLSFSADQSINTRGTGDDMVFSWDFGNGEVQESRTVEKNFIELSQPGHCAKVTLTARDMVSGTSATSAPLLFFVKNALPTLTDIEVSPAMTSACKAPCTVRVKAKGARDPDGRIETYRWWAVRKGDIQKKDLHTTSQPETSITLPPWGVANAKNTYSIVVEMVDNDGGKSISDDILGAPPTIETINGSRALYSADFSVDKTLISVGESVLFTAHAQETENLPNEAYLWDFDGDGEFDDTTSGPSVRHTFSQAGEFAVRLTVRYQGVSDSSSQTIFVAEKQQLPIADFSYEVHGIAVSFRGSLSQWDASVPGNALSYAWDFDTHTDSNHDGNPANDIDSREENPVHVYTTTGEKTVRLTVTNINGKTHSATKTVSLGASSASLFEHDEVLQSIPLRSTMPMAQLMLAVRKSANVPSMPAEITAYGFNADGSLLSGVVNITLEKGEGEIVAADEKMTNGVARAFFVPNKEHQQITIRATAKSTSGLLSETLSWTQ